MKKMEGAELLFRDSRDIQPSHTAYEDRKGSTDNMYSMLEPAAFVACQEDIWQPINKTDGEDGDQGIKVHWIIARVARPWEEPLNRVLHQTHMRL